MICGQAFQKDLSLAAVNQNCGNALLAIQIGIALVDAPEIADGQISVSGQVMIAAADAVGRYHDPPVKGQLISVGGIGHGNGSAAGKADPDSIGLPFSGGLIPEFIRCGKLRKRLPNVLRKKRLRGGVGAEQIDPPPDRDSRRIISSGPF